MVRQQADRRSPQYGPHAARSTRDDTRRGEGRDRAGEDACWRWRPFLHHAKQHSRQRLRSHARYRHRNREPQSRSMCPRKEGIIAVGEIADMMLDGILCECCGAFIDVDDASGFPRYCCGQCARDRGALPDKPKLQEKENNLTRIIRRRPLTLRRHESYSTSGCADMASRGHFAVVGRLWSRMEVDGTGGEWGSSPAVQTVSRGKRPSTIAKIA
jgi:hypothetical protein